MNSTISIGCICVGVLFVVAPSATGQTPTHEWQFTKKNAVGDSFKAVQGQLDAALRGPLRFAEDKVGALILEGDERKGHRIDITADISKAGLPKREITVEAWVRIDRFQKWGGIIGAIQDNGNYERGWLLGFQGNRFFFALSSAKKKRLTFLKSAAPFQTGYWYHVVGVYDGKSLRTYVDGKLQAQSGEQQGDIFYPPRVFYTIAAYRDDNELYPIAGQMESVAVFDEALSSSQIANRFQQSVKRFPNAEAVAESTTGWPTYLRDNQRTGITDDSLKFPLRLAWVHKTQHPPNPCWPEPAKHDYWHKKFNLDARVTFDRAFHVVSDGHRVYFASSSEDQVSCLDAKTGRKIWTFFTEGPVRCAPTLHSKQVLFGCDDGNIYCLDGNTGELKWKQSAAADSRRIAGNGRIISAWPIRTDVLIADGKGFVCTGVFPSQGVFQVTLDPRDGRILGRQQLGISAQGYLARVGDKLFVPTGRAPAGAYIARLSRRGKPLSKAAKNLSKDYPHAFIGAKGARLGGGDGKIAAFSAADGKQIWTSKVQGKAYSLAVAGGRLFAATDKGHIYCYAPADTLVKNVAQTGKDSSPPVQVGKTAANKAIEILKRSGVTKGYCLLLGSDNAGLALALALKSEMKMVVREPDTKKVQAVRRLLDEAGLHGRVSVHQGAFNQLPYSDFLFNVVVGNTAQNHDEVSRVLRPSGGVAFLGKDTAIRRGPLPGAGEWTHQYADPGNTACSNDARVTGPLQLQWFGRPGPRKMIDRHHRTAAPLYKNGRMFIPGEDHVIGVDAYNGTILWDRMIPNSRRVAVLRDCSYLAVDGNYVFVAAGDKCLAIDPQTGKTDRTIAIPGQAKSSKDWGMVAVVNGTLIGSAVKQGSSRRDQGRQVIATSTYKDNVPAVCSDYLFAVEPNSGKTLWVYRPKQGLIPNPAVALSGATVFFIESKNQEALKQPLSRARLQELVGNGSELVALDLKSGKQKWRVAGPFEKIRHNIYVCHSNDKVVVAGTRNSGTNKQSATVLYDLFVLDAKNGKLTWKKTHDPRFRIGGDHGEQDQHPVIVGDKLYCEPFAYDLHTGKTIDWKWPWTRGRRRRACGNISASAGSLFFRDQTLSMFDLSKHQTSKVTQVTRPGCWINLIPAGGLLLAPEASSGCSCNFAVQTSLALAPVQKPQPPKGFKAIFNGRNLAGWNGSAKYWKVEDGCLTGVADGTLKYNRFILWKGGTVKNFELRVKVKVTPGGNSGIQYRGTHRPDLGKWVVTGYQCDVVARRADYNGMLYEERGRRILAHTGEKVIIDVKGKPWVVGKFAIKKFKPGQWHDFRVLVRGNHHQHWINGHPTVDVIDMDKKGRKLEGVLAVQVHVGPPMKIQYKDIYLQQLPENLPLITPDRAKIPATARRVIPQGKDRPGVPNEE